MSIQSRRSKIRLKLWFLMLAVSLSPPVTLAQTLGYWQFQDRAPNNVAIGLSSQINSALVSGNAQTVAGGPALYFSSNTAGFIYDGEGGPLTNATNGASVRLSVGSGSLESGGTIAIPGNTLKPASFTFEMFIKIETDRQFSSLAGKMSATGGNQMSWQLDTGNDGRLRARIDNLNGSAGQFNQTVVCDPDKGQVADNRWHHVAATYDATNGGFTLYVDYQVVGFRAINGPLVYDDLPFYIGEVPGARAIGALFDEARLSDQVLAPVRFLRAVKLSSNAVDYDRFQIADPDQHALIQSAGNLSGGTRYIDTEGKPKVPWLPVVGWFDYDLQVVTPGWYELLLRSVVVDPMLNGYEKDYIIDGNIYLNSYWYNTSSSAEFKAGGVWLDAGRHTLRIQRHYWTGIQPLTHLEFRAAQTNVAAQHVRVALAGNEPFSGPFIRKGGSFDLEVFYSGPATTFTAVVNNRTDSPGSPLFSVPSISLAASSTVQKYILTIPGVNEGGYRLSFLLSGQPIAQRDVRGLDFDVIDTTPVTAVRGEITKTLVGSEINCASTNPNWPLDPTTGGTTNIVTTTAGSYRESGDVGYTQYASLPHRDPNNIDSRYRMPSWFGYTLPAVEAGATYLVETDYPDDAARTYVIAIRDQDTMDYTLSSGVDSGGEYAKTGSMLTHSMLYWPRTNQSPRLVMINAQSGRRAACGRIRLYRVEGPLPLLRRDAPVGGRSFGHWFEEPLGGLISVYGAPDRKRASLTTAAKRWAETVAYLGGDTLSVSANIYSLLYPSRNYGITLTNYYQPDVFRMLLLVAEKYGLKVTADFHPRADERDWPLNAAEPKLNKLVNKSGQSNGRYIPDPNDPFRLHKTQEYAPLLPVFNPIYPQNRDWYRAMLGEFTDRYADATNFVGISLRGMNWQNKSFNNFFNLDWGYDDYTIGRFSQDSGFPDPGARQYSARHQLLVNPPYRQQWIDWRAQQITGIYKGVQDRVRSGNPRVKISSYIFSGFTDGLREAGLDTIALARQGVAPVHALHEPGRSGKGIVLNPNRTFDPNVRALTDQIERDKLVDPASLASMHGPDGTGNFVFKAYYFEDGAVIPPEQLGFAPCTPTKCPYTSGHILPSGRSFLERYALALAETDATSLLSGGNAYFIDQPIMREFVAEYRQLPATPFTRRADTVDPVAVWERKDSSGYIFYAVNREYYPVTIELSFEDKQKFTRLSTNTQLSARSKLTVTLQPFQLLVYRADSGISIDSVTTTLPSSKKNQVRNQINWLNQLLVRAQGDANHLGLSGEQMANLRQGISDVTSAYNSGALWRARTRVERYRLLEIYQKPGIGYPPSYRYPTS